MKHLITGGSGFLGNLIARRLHARRLAFQHPGTGRKVMFEAPWPEDFQEALRALR